MKKLLVLLYCCISPAIAAPFMIGDVSVARADQCVYTRSVSVISAVVVDMVNGLPANGYRVCKIDLVNDPINGIVTLALRDSSSGETGPVVIYTFPPSTTQGGVSG